MGWALLHEIAISTSNDEHVDLFVLVTGAITLGGNRGNGIFTAGDAAAGYGAGGTGRLARGTHGGAEFHEGLVQRGTIAGLGNERFCQ